MLTSNIHHTIYHVSITYMFALWSLFLKFILIRSNTEFGGTLPEFGLHIVILLVQSNPISLIQPMYVNLFHQVITRNFVQCIPKIKNKYKSSKPTIKGNEVGCDISKMVKRKPWTLLSRMNTSIQQQFMDKLPF